MLKKRGFRALTLILALAVLSAFGTLESRAQAYEDPDSGYGVYICDEANLLTDQEEAELLSVMAAGAGWGHMVFLTVSVNPYSDTEYLAGEYFEKTLGLQGQDGTVFVIDMDCRQVFLYAEGKNLDSLPLSRTDTITDNTYSYASRGDYYGCAAEAFSEVAAVLQGQRIAQPMKYTSNALLALLVSMFLCFLLCCRGAGAQKTGRSELLQVAEKKFARGGPLFTLTNTTRIYDPPSSSSSGGSGGGHSGGGGGGGHSGGGSGHSF